MEWKIYILSDIHLKPKDTRKKVLADFLKKAEGKIILLGDIFDIWIGRNEEYTTEFSEIVNIIERKKDSIIYVEGNHDFNLVWLDDMGVRRARETEIILPNRKKIFLAHGDMYSGELMHRIYRKTVLSTEKLFKFITNGYFTKSVNKIGEILSNLSYRKNISPSTRGKRKEIFANMIKNAIDIAEKNQYDYVIFGHCHIPSLMKVGNKIIANSGYWGKKEGTFLIITASQNEDEIKLEKINVS
jgi:UDP-2,3-diacylglucosamine pyrophosphatase LpxH